MKETGFLIILCTAPNPATASQIANTLVKEHLAACCNIVPGLQSIYSWEGQVRTEEEVLIIVKTHAAVYKKIEHRIQEIHPYEVPEILAFSVRDGQADYLKWVGDYVKSD